MSNMLDYIRWRGDLSLATVPINEVDGLILAQLSMFHWENGLEPGSSALLRDLFDSMNRQPVSVGFTAENDQKLLALVTESARFGEVIVSDFEHDFDEDAEMQFAAITLHLPDGVHYVSFRGTDSSIVGWKEDCNMAFSKPVPAQEAAVDYLTRMAGKYPGALRVGGHSKGGNLAMYAAAKVDDAVRARILAVYNNDGPGLSDRMDAPALYARITGRLRSFVPQGSIVGLLLAHPDEFSVIRSNSVSIFQHDPYSWQVEGPRFVRMSGLNRDSARFDVAFRQWLAGVDESEREELVETLFGILEATHAQSFGREFWAGLAKNAKSVLAAIHDIRPETRKRVSRMLADLGALAVKPPSDPEEER